jgi:hypothetical protein
MKFILFYFLEETLTVHVEDMSSTPYSGIRPSIIIGYRAKALSAKIAL